MSTFLFQNTPTYFECPDYSQAVDFGSENIRVGAILLTAGSQKAKAGTQAGLGKDFLTD